MDRWSPLASCLVVGLAVGCNSPIEVEDDSGGNATTTSSDTDSRPDPSAPYPTMTSGGNYTSGAYTTGYDTGWYTTSGAWTSGWDTDWTGGGWTSFGTFGDDWGTWGSGGLGPCWDLGEVDCLNAASFGLDCAWLPRYDLTSDVSCAWEPIGSMCVSLEAPETPGCVAPSSCANIVATFHVDHTYGWVIPYQGCAPLLGYDTCVPGSPSPDCACACANPPWN